MASKLGHSIEYLAPTYSRLTFFYTQIRRKFQHLRRILIRFYWSAGSVGLHIGRANSDRHQRDAKGAISVCLWFVQPLRCRSRVVTEFDRLILRWTRSNYTRVVSRSVGSVCLQQLPCRMSQRFVVNSTVQDAFYHSRPIVIKSRAQSLREVHYMSNSI